jgi:very-short-patch-repair endonuclease
LKKSQEQVGFARELRGKQTNAEKALWAKLRNKQLQGVKFRRQQPLSSYIVDFVSFERKLIIEIDGGQHNEDKFSPSPSLSLQGRGILCKVM